MVPYSTSSSANPTLTVDPDRIGWIIFHDPQRPWSTLTQEVMGRFRSCLGEAAGLETQGKVRALVISSPPGYGFSAGADVRAIEAIQDPAAAEEAVRFGQGVFQLLDDLPIPTVAAIDGLCLGGAAELALACDWRVCSGSDRTRFGFPEVRLGILPAWGGAARLPRLVGLRRALPLILTGGSVTATRARNLGLVDRVFPVEGFREMAGAFAREAGEASPRREPAFSFLDRSKAGRALSLRRARRRVAEETQGHFPAPLAVLSLLRQSDDRPLQHALDLAARSAADLIPSPVSKNLIHLFHLREEARKVEAPSQAPNSAAGSGRLPEGPGEDMSPPGALSTVAIVGRGSLVGALAQSAASRGLRVYLFSEDPVGFNKATRVADGLVFGDVAALGSAIRVAAQLFARAVRRGRMEAGAAQAGMARISVGSSQSELAECDMVMALDDQVTASAWEVGRRLVSLEAQLPPHAILVRAVFSPAAGSAQPQPRLATLGRHLSRPHLFGGVQLFHPLHRRPLVEIARADASSEDTLATLQALVVRLGKVPVLVRDRPGLLVNRILDPARDELRKLRGEGVGRGALNAACRGMGTEPEVLGLKKRSRFARPWGRARGDAAKAVQSTETIAHRLFLAMVIEASKVLEEGVVSRAGEVDLALVASGGFPAFRGGLLRYADTFSPGVILSQLYTARDEWGTRFTPTAAVEELASDGRSFYEAFP